MFRNKNVTNTFPRFLTCNKQLPGDATATGPDCTLGSKVFQHQRLSARKDSTAGGGREGQLQQREQKHQRSSANTYAMLQVVYHLCARPTLGTGRGSEGDTCKMKKAWFRHPRYAGEERTHKQCVLLHNAECTHRDDPHLPFHRDTPWTEAAQDRRSHTGSMSSFMRKIPAGMLKLTTDTCVLPV